MAVSTPSRGPAGGSSRGTAKGRRIAEKPRTERRRPRLPAVRSSPTPPSPVARSGLAGGTARLGAALLLVGLGLLVTAAVGVGPRWLDGVGALVVATVLSGALAHRTGGRPLVAVGLAVAIGLLGLLLDLPAMRTAAAIGTVVVGGVYAVMATVPAVSFVRAAREVLFATAISSITAMAAIGFEPTFSPRRFEYAALLLALALVVAVVYRLGAGFHGLGRRGILAVVVGAVGLVLTLAYGELLREYGAGSVVESVVGFAAWTREHLGAFPRPLVVFLGIPALLWGCFQRARRRQGWWVCAFGVAATVPLAQGLLDPDGSFLEAGLRTAYSLVLGMAVGYLVVRIDLALTAPRGRRGRRAEEADAHRPEPTRFAEL